MIPVTIEQLYYPRFVCLWMLMALKAGYLNALGFLATGMFVSHVTGFGTNVGMALSHEEIVFGMEMLVIPIAYILGSSVPSFILDNNYDANVTPKYHYVQFMITLTLGILFFLGVSGYFGEFATYAHDDHDIIIAGALCFVCGMMNGLSTWSTFGRIRVTHLTGLSTDIGLHLPKLLRHGKSSRFPERRRINSVRVLTFMSFSLGSLSAAFIIPRLGFWGLSFPLALAVFLSAVSYVAYVQTTQPQSQEGAHAHVK